MDRVAICIPTHTSISAVLFDQWIGLSAWCAKNNIPIITIANRTHNDARNWLATAGGGFEKPNLLIDQMDYILWIDSDQVFTLKDIQTILSCKSKFCTGWYLKGDTPMVARWDEKVFLKTGSMNFVPVKELEQSKGKLIEVSYCGFGFTKTHTDLFKGLTYPFFRNEVVQIGDYQENVSEDATFCLYVERYLDIRPRVIADLKIGHLKEQVI